MQEARAQPSAGMHTNWLHWDCWKVAPDVKIGVVFDFLPESEYSLLHFLTSLHHIISCLVCILAAVKYSQVSSPNFKAYSVS